MLGHDRDHRGRTDLHSRLRFQDGELSRHLSYVGGVTRLGQHVGIGAAAERPCDIVFGQPAVDRVDADRDDRPAASRRRDRAGRDVACYRLAFAGDRILEVDDQRIGPDGQAFASCARIARNEQPRAKQSISCHRPSPGFSALAGSSSLCQSRHSAG
jgi:hypothetical protein